MERLDFTPITPFVSSMYDENPGIGDGCQGEQSFGIVRRKGTIPPGAAISPDYVGTADQWSGDITYAQRLKAGDIGEGVCSPCMASWNDVYTFCQPNTPPRTGGLAPTSVVFNPTGSVPGTSRVVVDSGWFQFNNPEQLGWPGNRGGASFLLSWIAQITWDQFYAITGVDYSPLPGFVPGVCWWYTGNNEYPNYNYGGGLILVIGVPPGDWGPWKDSQLICSEDNQGLISQWAMPGPANNSQPPYAAPLWPWPSIATVTVPE